VREINPCDYCINWNKNTGQCREGVPWYAVSLDCGYFVDGLPVLSQLPAKKEVQLDLSLVLVDTL
jgi:hypothetical protein